MKGMKKLLSILMVLTLVLSLGASAFAAKVTIEDPDGHMSDHTFKAYQIFSGTQNDESGNELASIEWGTGIDSDAFLKALQDDVTIGSKFTDCKTAADVAKAIGGLDSETAEIVAEIAAAHTKGEGTEIEAGESVELPDGYYVIKDETPKEEIGEGGAYNDVVLQVTRDVNIKWKSDVPSSQKKVKDVNDTDGEGETGWQDGADWDIGDDVPFQLTGTLPENYSDYDSYKLAFHDKESTGLSFNKDSVEVFVDGVKITEGYTVVTEGLTDGCTFEVVFDNLKTTAAKDKSVITVQYTAKLNDTAVIGNPGNPNEMQMEYSNNPNVEGTGKTPWDKVTVFTFTLDVLKVDPESEPLAGAAFTLFKEVPAPTAYPEGQPYTSLKDEDGDPIELKVGDYYTVDGKVYKVVGVTTAGDATSFEFKGLDDGNYQLVETTVPDGYNKADDIFFTVSDVHTEDDKGTNEQSAEDLQVKVTKGDATITLSPTAGHLSTTVMNQSGVQLPETGGIGTTIFYIVGAVLVAGAVILLVTKKRVSGMEK